MNRKGGYDLATMLFSLLFMMITVVIFFMIFNYQEYASNTSGGKTVGDINEDVELHQQFIIYLQTPVHTCSIKEAEELNMSFGELIIYSQINDSSNYVNLPDGFSRPSSFESGSKLLSSIWGFCTIEYFENYINSGVYSVVPISYASFSGSSTYTHGSMITEVFNYDFLNNRVVIGNNDLVLEGGGP